MKDMIFKKMIELSPENSMIQIISNFDNNNYTEQELERDWGKILGQYF